jgi:acetyl-CoA C-acetyltransferase
MIDSMIYDGLWDSFKNVHMGLTGELVSEKYGVTREQQDTYAADSHRKAAHATKQGWFKDEILPVSIPQKKGDPIVIDRDEGIREDTTAESLARLKPAFKKDGTVTAGNAPGVNDGAAALVVWARTRGRTASSQSRASWATPRPASPKSVMTRSKRSGSGKAGWSLARWTCRDNEAFSVQAVAVLKELGIDPQKVNVNGGAVALGHAIGSSGARILTTLLYALKRRNLQRGIATLCLGGGNGVAMAVERSEERAAPGIPQH